MHYANPCLNCPPIPHQLPMDFPITVGFGCADVKCDGQTVLDGEAHYREFGEFVTVADAERLAAANPDAEWRIAVYGPLHGEVYARTAPGAWTLVERVDGFA